MGGTVPSLLFVLRPNCGRGNGGNASTGVISAPDPVVGTVNPHLCQRFLDTHRQVGLDLLWDHCSFLLGPGGHEVLFVPSKSLFSQSCISSVVKSHWPPKSKFLGVHIPFA